MTVHKFTVGKRHYPEKKMVAYIKNKVYHLLVVYLFCFLCLNLLLLIIVFSQVDFIIKCN